MTDYTDTLADGYVLRLRVNENDTDVPTNSSTVGWSLVLIKGTGSGKWSGNTSSWHVNIGGKTHSGTFTYDFRNYSSKTLGSDTETIVHKSDGTKTIAVSATFTDAASPLIGNGSISDNKPLSDIPRASTPIFSPEPADAGTSVTITTNRAVSTFTHDITYSLGTASGTVATGVGASTAWTPPLSLLTQFPNSATADITITTKTYNSSSDLIGTTTTLLTISAPATAVPDFTTVTNSETVSAVATNVGGYVQGLSKLALAITGAVGYQGSTIVSYKIQVAPGTAAAQTINASSGISTAIAASGSVDLVGTVTDSRGRSKSKTVTVTVLAYAPPTISTSDFKIQRANSSGVLQDDGDRLKITINATVQSLIVGGTQKNAMTYKVYTKLRTDTSWGAAKLTASAGGITFNSYALVGTYDVMTAYDVLVEIDDKFGAVTLQGTVSVAAVFMHWGDGLGIGKYWERGGVDIFGQLYQRNGGLTDPTGGILIWPASTVPAGWLLCIGQSLLRTSYPDLFALIGTQFGAVDSTHFTLPNLKSRFPVGVDAATTEFNALGNVGGSLTHNHTLSSLGQALITIAQGGGAAIVRRVSTASWSATQEIGTTGQASTQTGLGTGAQLQGTTDATRDIPPFIALNFIIRT